MKHAHNPARLDGHDDITAEIVLIATCCAVGLAALLYLLAL